MEMSSLKRLSKHYLFYCVATPLLRTWLRGVIVLDIIAAGVAMYTSRRLNISSTHV